MRRTIVAALAAGWIWGTAFEATAHDGAEFAAHLHRIPAPLAPIEAHGDAHLAFAPHENAIHYSIHLHGLDLEPIAANRTDVNDVIGIHLHLIVPDQIGPHILNIFGVPGEDDGDLVVDYEHESLSGKFDLSDASRDPATGELYPQFFPLTTKVITDWIDDLHNNELYLAVHTAGENGGPLLHGDVLRVPEPTAGALGAATLALGGGIARRVRRR